MISCFNAILYRMDIIKMLGELRREKAVMDEAVLVLERLAGRRTRAGTRRTVTARKRRPFSAATRKRMAIAQKRRWAAARKKQKAGAAKTTGS